jgi:hypothetical protein
MHYNLMMAKLAIPQQKILITFCVLGQYQSDALIKLDDKIGAGKWAVK